MEQRELSLLMKRLITGYKALLETMIEQEGITLAQIRMLNALNERKEVSAAELARNLLHHNRRACRPWSSAPRPPGGSRDLPHRRTGVCCERR